MACAQPLDVSSLLWVIFHLNSFQGSRSGSGTRPCADIPSLSIALAMWHYVVFIGRESIWKVTGTRVWSCPGKDLEFREHLQCECAQLLLCPTLCDPMDYSLPGSSVHGIFKARMLEWVAISYSRGSFWPRDRICFSCIFCNGRRILYHWDTWEALQYCPLSIFFFFDIFPNFIVDAYKVKSQQRIWSQFPLRQMKAWKLS